MPAIVKLQLSLEALAEAISSLDLQEKRQLQELIEQQIFEAEEALYEDDAETLAEVQAVRAEYRDGESITIDEYLANRSNQKSDRIFWSSYSIVKQERHRWVGARHPQSFGISNILLVPIGVNLSLKEA
ncbi:hypothetical protein [Tolypothrix sp. PCC 7910]|uniref:hypothetical protein n=1 Tax=Tolypothrix sp. PCC 7910 TaxID=2099387 RepID=UPI001FCAA771|nr:hypothetical protein [Tolypothrix sp. PCC 7910]